MHTLNRVLTLLFILVVALPPATFALMNFDSQQQAEDSLQNAIQSAVQTYRRSGVAQSTLTKGQNLQEKGQALIKTLEEKKLDLRKKIIVQRDVIDYVSTHYKLPLTGTGQITLLIDSETKRLIRMVRADYVRQQIAGADLPRFGIVQSVLHSAAGEAILPDSSTLQTAQIRFIGDLKAAERAFETLPVLEKERDSVLAQYLVASRQIADGEEMVQHSDAVLAQIQQITKDVHDQVLKMQSDLARVDARLKSKAERALIEKGLLDPSTLSSNTVVNHTPAFHWPAYGPVSAGFMNAAYKKIFGVPHLGQDIVVPQGSPVYAAADGVVFLVRDGGLKGYSYILIGHRDGYATLYGHISQALVSAGQEVVAGQNIALSGGKPGTHGAGPMTTAAHLHFEVIRAGTNVDPKSVLP